MREDVPDELRGLDGGKVGQRDEGGSPAAGAAGDEVVNFSEPFIRRPVMTTLLMLSFIVFGVFGYMKLPVSALPRVDFPTIQVSARLPGANSEIMATSVVAPLERGVQVSGAKLALLAETDITGRRFAAKLGTVLGQNILVDAIVIQYQDGGKPSTVWPFNLATKKIIYPIPKWSARK